MHECQSDHERDRGRASRGFLQLTDARVQHAPTPCQDLPRFSRSKAGSESRIEVRGTVAPGNNKHETQQTRRAENLQMSLTSLMS